MVLLAQRIVSCLDTAEERRAAVDYGTVMLRDGKVSVGEWARFGKTLGILKGRHEGLSAMLRCLASP
jgi:hypothetical protein